MGHKHSKHKRGEEARPSASMDNVDAPPNTAPGGRGLGTQPLNAPPPVPPLQQLQHGHTIGSNAKPSQQPAKIRHTPPSYRAGPPQPIHRPLDRRTREIRLLRIFPPQSKQNHGDPLAFASDIIRGELQYASLDEIRNAGRKSTARNALEYRVLDALFAPLPGGNADSESNRLMLMLNRQMRAEMTASDKIDSSTSFTMGKARLQALNTIYGRSHEVLKSWLPQVLQLMGAPLSVNDWQQTWLWRPLSGNESHTEVTSNNFFALSYAWQEQNKDFEGSFEAKELLKLAQAGGVSFNATVKQPQSQTSSSDKASAPQKHEIELNGRMVDAGERLEQALRALREIPEVQNGTRIWVDKLCINQGDGEEKGWQVKMMGDIYKTAERVISWLGEEADRSGEVLEAMNAIGHAVMSEAESSTLSQYLFSNLDTEFLWRLTQILTRTYWSRMWIQQEIAMSDDKSLTICGARRFPTSHILTFAKRVSAMAPRLAFNDSFLLGRRFGSGGLPVGTLNVGLAKLRDIFDVHRNLDAIIAPSISISTLWFRIPSSCAATDPRDLVYGMVSLLPSSLAAELRVDYSDRHSYRDAMMDFAAAHMKVFQSLSWILYRPWSPFPGHVEWPSWLPNLGIRFSRAHFMWALNAPDIWKDHPIIKTFTWRIYPEPGWLLATGVPFDTIYQATSSMGSQSRRSNEALLSNPELMDYTANLPGVDQQNFIETTRLLTLATFPEPSPFTGTLPPLSATHRYHNHHGLKRALSECFSQLNLFPANENDTIFDIPLSSLASGADSVDMAVHGQPSFTLPAMHVLHRVLEVWSELNLWGASLHSFFRQSASGNHIPQLQMEGSTIGHGSLFQTCEGYVGAALCNLRAGDRLYTLVGCPMPVALRPSLKHDGKWELVGGVFIPGLMYREIVYGNQLSKLERLVLC